MWRRSAGRSGGGGRAAARRTAAVALVLGVGAAAVSAAGAAAALPAAGVAATTTPAAAPGSGPGRLAVARTGKAAYEARCSLRPSFRQLVQASAHPDGECVHLEGQVFQYGPGRGPRTMLLDVTDTGGGIWDTTVEIRLPATLGGRAIATDDVVDVWGPVGATATARTHFGGRIHVPVVDARYVALRQAIGSTITTPSTT